MLYQVRFLRKVSRFSFRDSTCKDEVDAACSLVVVFNFYKISTVIRCILKKNLNASRPSEHPPDRGNVSKRVVGIIGCKDKTSSWH